MTAANEVAGEATAAAGRTKPILDTETGKEYSSMYKAGQDLGPSLAADSKQDRLVWFAIARKYPDRFKTRSTSGEWVALNDPSVPVITRVKRTESLDERRARLLQELGEVDAARASAASGAAVASNGNTEATAADAVSDEEVVEEEAAKPTPGPAKGKLAAAMTGKK